MATPTTSEATTASPPKEIIIPHPTAQYAVGMGTTKLTDTTRTDPYDPASGDRNVMISLFYPLEKSTASNLTQVPYMPPLTTKILDTYLPSIGIPPIFSSLRLQTYSPDAATQATSFPLILFSPGLSVSRHQYNALAQHIAAAGYCVVTLDHTYEAVVVEYPSGPPTMGFPPTHWDPKTKLERHEEALATRVADARFVLTSLGDLSVVQQLMPGATKPFEQKAVIIGHSFGGATAISTLMQDERFLGAVNMDGSQYGPLSPTTKPVLLMGRGEPNRRDRSNNETWGPLWEACKGWKKEVNLRGAEHTSFADIPLVVEVAGVERTPVVRKMCGEAEGRRGFDAVVRYVVEFLGVVVKGGEGEVGGGLFGGKGDEDVEVL